MRRRALGSTGLSVSPIGLGTVKLGRTKKLRYAEAFDLPSESEAVAMVRGALEGGVNLIDTAPAYGLAEARVGAALAGWGGRREEVVLCTKAGEVFDEVTGASGFDFSLDGVLASVERSLRLLRVEAVDVLLLHSDGGDLAAMERGGAEALLEAKRRGWAKCVGLSGKTVDGARSALDWADVLMVAFHAEDDSHRGVMRAARERGVGVLVKKGLASGRLDAGAAVGFLMGEASVDCAVVGTRTLGHLLANVAAAERALGGEEAREGADDGG